MDIRILEKQKQHEIYDSAYRLLAEADNEFVPPLSSRSSSTQQNFSNTLQSDNITTYFEQLKNQRFAVVFEEGELIAFVSFNSCSEVCISESNH